MRAGGSFKSNTLLLSKDCPRIDLNEQCDLAKQEIDWVCVCTSLQRNHCGTQNNFGVLNMPGKPLEQQVLNLPLVDFKNFHRSADVRP